MSRVRVGDYVVDIVSGELWSAGGGGERIVLREQPLRVLRLLIEYDGRIATREEIKKKLWPNNTNVDFDRSINVAIRFLRRALGDSADHPRYIETLARRGYRLLVPVERLESEPVPAGAPAAEAATEPSGLIGKKVSHYRVLSVIGGGGMGMVYQAEDLKLGRRVALKFLPEELADDPGALRLLQREAQTASALNHPNICTIHEIEEHAGQPFIAMELLEGQTVLERLTSRPGPVPLAELVDVGVQVCNGLEAAHERGIIHRDIKPPNLFLTRQGAVKILDFGVAKLAETEDIAGRATPGGGTRPDGGTRGRSFRSITAVGTPSYMSPEQVRRERLDTRTDLFSLGLVLYQMAAGRRAFEGDTEAAIHDAILTLTPKPARAHNPAVPGALDQVLAKALEKDRARRYQSAAELREDLRGLLTRKRSTRSHSLAWAVAAAAALLGIGIGVYSWLHRPVRLSDSDTVVLADLSNETGDSVFDTGLNETLRGTGLGQTPYLNVLAPEKVIDAFRLLNLPPTTKLTPDIALRVCGRTNSRMVIQATIANAGNRYQIELSALDCQSKRRVARAKDEAGGRNEVVHTLGVTAARLREMLGEPETSIARFNQPLDLATSASPEALQQLILGFQHHYSLGFREAAANYRRAIELDSNFALAYGVLATALHELPDPVGEMKAATKSYELRDRLAVPQRLRAEWLYQTFVAGDLEKACAAAKQWAQTFPREYPARIDFSACLNHLGQRDGALAEAREAVRLRPSVLSYLTEATLSILAGQVQEANAALEQASTRGLDSVKLHYQRGRVSFLAGDTVTMHAQMRWAEGKPGAAPIVMGESEFEAFHGRFRRARALLQRALALGPQGGLEPSMIARSVLQEAEVGNAARARHAADSLIRRASDADAALILILALARAGSVTAARAYADSFARRRPENTLVQKFYLPTIYGAISLEEHDPAGAIEALHPARAYDFALPDWADEVPLSPAYVRGLSYSQLHDGRRAAGEFQKLLDRPGIVGRSITGALARLQLARAQRMAGDTASARASYQDFLTLWRDADPDIPIYQAARAEYARLSRLEITDK